MRLAIFILLLTSFNSFAYDKRKCSKFTDAPLFYAGGPIASSTTSYVSSTGPCAAIGYHSKENKKIYYAQNELELQLDIARGKGPYLAELNSIYGCMNTLQVNEALMKEYEVIYNSTNPSERVDGVLNKQNCKYL